MPFAVYEGLHFDFASVGWPDYLAITYSGIVVTAVAFILFYKGASAVPATTVGVFAGFMPISSVLLSGLILGEELLPRHILGLSFVVAGIGLMAATKEPGLRPADPERGSVPHPGGRHAPLAKKRLV